jgi:hypothetical protein
MVYGLGMVKKAATKKLKAPTKGSATVKVSPEERLYNEITAAIERYQSTMPHDPTTEEGLDYVGGIFNVLATHLGAADRMLDILGAGLGQRFEHLVTGLTVPEGDEGPNPLAVLLADSICLEDDGHDSCEDCDCGNCLLDSNPATDPKDIN